MKFRNATYSAWGSGSHVMRFVQSGSIACYVGSTSALARSCTEYFFILRTMNDPADGGGS